MAGPLVSVLINNFNYASFLGDAIESALGQIYAPIEVIVVDDGSTDRSPSIIEAYANRVVPVMRENAGQASAFNAGVVESRGEILCFLDADDFFYPDKIRVVVAKFAALAFRSEPILVHHPLDVLNEEHYPFAPRFKGLKHESPLNLYNYAAKYGHVYYPASPTSGVSINRVLADRIFPLPVGGTAISADDFVVKAAALIGELYALDEALGAYRIHGRNRWFGSQGMHFPEFSAALDEFLNRKLIENGRSPVIAWHNSMYSWPRLIVERRWAELLSKMIIASVRNRDLHTVEFGLRTLRLAFTENKKSWTVHRSAQQTR